MSSQRNLIGIIVGIALVILVIYLIKRNVKESFVDTPRMALTQTIAVSSNGNQHIIPSCKTADPTTQFISTPSFQSMLAPRFQSTPFGAFIKYKPTSIGNLAVPENPLGYSKTVTEAFMGDDQGGNKCGSCKNYGCGTTCAQSGMNIATLSSVGINNYTGSVINTSLPSNPVITDSLPVGTMTVQNQDSVDGPEQFQVYDRLIYANKKSRLLAHGDSFRGDIPIAPRCTSQEDAWFNVSANPARDLRVGYVQSLAGSNIDNNADMKALQLQYMGNSSLIGGFGTTNTSTILSSAGDTGVVVTAFP